ncbi:RNA polymerase sigma-70 factor [Olivibacter sp. SDN3]|uniref:RNA polymerase sigma factor n=1 Tax=Olivibacter sp. SDN3 TaxID=2764720 RepID=UPI001651AE19|nr:RNA polymerase sigma-70 factor [Olivibacter sp. SDN3]QNL50193.1 RNA polymerase sigma-70 factor [Olivibacter sp. SDN3]
MKPSIDNDVTRLLFLMSKGDERAFETIYRKYKQPIAQFVLKYVHCRTQTDDITQEIFIKIWENRDKIAGIKSFKSYLFTVARNHTLNCLKRIVHAEDALNHLTTHLPECSTTLDELQFKEYNQFIDMALYEMPERTLKIFKLCREEGKSYEEAAATLGVSRNAIKNHMVKAMKTLSHVASDKLDITLVLIFMIFC